MNNLQITINNVEQAEPEMLADVLARIPREVIVAEYAPLSVAVDVNPRVPADAPVYKHPGWCEYGITFRYAFAQPMFLMAIQRTPESETEFHS